MLMDNKRIQLPSGGWVEMRDPNYLRSRDRDALIREISGPAVENLPKVDAGLRAIKVIASILITAWNLPYQPEENTDGVTREWTLPKNDLTIIDELLASDVATIEAEVSEAQKVLMPQRPSPDQHADPESPSTPESE